MAVVVVVVPPQLTVSLRCVRDVDDNALGIEMVKEEEEEDIIINVCSSLLLFLFYFLLLLIFFEL